MRRAGGAEGGRVVSAKDRKLALAQAISELSAKRDPVEPDRWIYRAEETDSWWSVGEDSLLTYIEFRDRLSQAEAYEIWAESDDDSYEFR